MNTYELAGRVYFEVDAADAEAALALVKSALDSTRFCVDVRGLRVNQITNAAGFPISHSNNVPHTTKAESQN